MIIHVEACQWYKITVLSYVFPGGDVVVANISAISGHWSERAEQGLFIECISVINLI
jgi:hypothetical protein